MTEDRETWVSCAATLAAARPDYLARLVAEAERDGPAREAVELAAQFMREDGLPVPDEVVAFLIRKAKKELPALRTKKPKASYAFRDLRLAAAVRELTDQKVQKGAAEQLVAEREGMSAEAVRKAIDHVRTLRRASGNYSAD